MAGRHGPAIAAALCGCFINLPARATSDPATAAPPAVARAIAGAPALAAIRRAHEPRQESIAGHGIDTATGAQTLERRLLPFDAGQPFSLGIHYNSIFAGVDGPLGRGWRHEYQGTISGDVEGRMTISWGGHFENSYRYTNTVNGERHYTPEDIAARHDRLVLSSNNLFTLTRADGTQYRFSRSLTVLQRVSNKVGHIREFNLENGAPYRPRAVFAGLTSAEIGFVYDRDGLIDYVYDARVSTGTPRYVDFTYDPQRRLTRITQPVVFGGDEFQWSPTNIIAPAGNPAGITASRQITQSGTAIGLVRITSGTINSGTSDQLTLKLISPSGTEAIVYDRVPDPTVSRSLSALASPISAFDGENPNGTWRLVVISSGPVDLRITSFAIRFSGPSHPTRFAYDNEHRLTGASDEIGPLFATTYDAAGRVATQDDGRSDNQLMRFAYEEHTDNTLRTIVTDRLGQQSALVHDERYRLLSWTDALGHSVAFTYDSSGNRTSRTSALGHVTRFAYDASHNLTSVVDAAGKTTIFSYDANRNVTVVHDARGTETRFGYDARNNLTSITDFLGRTTRRTYDAGNSQLKSVTLPDGGTINLGYNGINCINFVSHPMDGSRGASATYDGQGRVVRRTDAAGNATTFVYSPTGRLLEERNPDGATKTAVYDARDRVIAETDELGHTTRYQYDGNDNVVATTDALGHPIRNAYDGEDRLIRITNALEHSRSTTYDAAGQRIAESDGLGRTTRYHYDADGNLTSVEDPDGVTIERKRYTARAELESEAGAYNHPTAYSYDEMGNLATATDPAGRRVTYNYDPLNRHVTLTDAAARITRQSFDPDGLLEAITDAGGRKTEFAYDRANRLTEIIFGSRIISYEYDDFRDLITRVRDGTSNFQFEYNRLGRKERTRVFAASSTTAERTLTYTYDAKGNLLRTADSRDGTSVARQLDALERVVRHTDAAGRQLAYAYDSAGRLSQLIYPGGQNVTYTYDAADQLTEVTDWAGRKTRFAYDHGSQIKRIDFPNGTYRVITYDRAGRPVSRSDHASDGATICGYRYEYAVDGRLESVTRTDATARYVPPGATMTFDANNRVTAYNGTPLTSELGGGLTRIPLPTGTAQVTYDARHRVASIGATFFTYDPEDRLTGWRDESGTTTLFVNPHGGLSQILERTTPAGSVTRYVHGIGLLYEDTGGSIRVYHYDDRGSTIALTDGSGGVVRRFSYGPYGEEIDPPAPGSTTPFRFLGIFGVLTDANGLCHMRSRFYSPVLRRFISEDFYPGELATPNSLNRYAYANGDPISFEDPDGEFLVNTLIGAVAGAIGGVVVQAVSDLVQGKKADWRDYVSAAVGGAITGGLIGSGYGVIFAGGAGGLTQNFLEQSLHGALTGERQFDVLALGVSTAAGAVGGKLGGSFSRGINGAVGSAFRKQVIRNGILYSSKQAALRAPVADIVKRTAIAVIARSVIGAGVGLVKGGALRVAAGGGESPGTARSGVPPAIASRQRFDQIRGFVVQGQRSNQGAFLHFSIYETWLDAALVPQPNSPNARPTSF